MAKQTHYIRRGDTVIPIGAILKRDGAAVDLAGKTVVCLIVNTQDAADVLVDHEAATIVDATAARVRFGLSAADVDTEGDYAVFFRIQEAGPTYDTFPAEDDFILSIKKLG